MKDKNREFEESGMFLDVMSKKERKKWEKEQQKLRKKEENENESNDENNEDINDNEMENNDENENKKENIETNETSSDETNTREMEPIGETISSEELEKEQEEKKEMLEFTEEMPKEEISKKRSKEKKEIDEEKTKVFEIDENVITNEDFNNDDADYKKIFNPTPLLSFIFFIAIIFYIYIIIFTNYNHSMYLIINGSILILMTLFIGLIANSKSKAFVILDILVILCFSAFNAVSLINYDTYYEKIDSDNKINEEKVENKEEDNKENNNPEIVLNEYSCTNSAETLITEIKETNNHVTYIKRNETFNDEELIKEISKYYEDIDGITIDIEDTTLILEFDFEILDINQYKVAVENYNNSLRLDTDFSYIDDDKILYDKYVTVELKDLTCKTKER